MTWSCYCCSSEQGHDDGAPPKKCHEPPPVRQLPRQLPSDAPVVTLGLKKDAEARCLIRRALKDVAPAAHRFGWRLAELRELAPSDADVGYLAEDATLHIKLRDPGVGGGFYPYSFVLATLLHEMTHLSYLGHGKTFYRRLVDAIDAVSAASSTKSEIRGHVCNELLNAVCENDARRAKALLAVCPEAANCRSCRPGDQCGQLPLEYAAHHGRVNLTKVLLKARADVDATCGSGSVPPLLRAAAAGNARTTKVLLEARADAATSAANNCKKAGSSEQPLKSPLAVAAAAMPGTVLALLSAASSTRKDDDPGSFTMEETVRRRSSSTASRAAARRRKGAPPPPTGPPPSDCRNGRSGGGGGSISLPALMAPLVMPSAKYGALLMPPAKVDLDTAWCRRYSGPWASGRGIMLSGSLAV